MRSIQRLFRDVVLATLVTAHPSLLGCGGSGLNVPCASSVHPQVSAEITYTVSVYYHTAENPTRIPVALCRMNISTVKNLCEGGAKGYMDFSSSYTNASGTFQFTVGYNLQNSFDSVVANVEAIPETTNIPWPLQRWQNTKVTDEITYDEVRASNGYMNRLIVVDILASR
jgi:hypothetical protein